MHQIVACSLMVLVGSFAWAQSAQEGDFQNNLKMVNDLVVAQSKTYTNFLELSVGTHPSNEVRQNFVCGQMKLMLETIDKVKTSPDVYAALKKNLDSAKQNKGETSLSENFKGEREIIEAKMILSSRQCGGRAAARSVEENFAKLEDAGDKLYTFLNLNDVHPENEE